MRSRILLCALLVMASTTSVMAANDGLSNTAPAQPQAGAGVQPGAPTCRQATAKVPLTAEQRAQRKALKAQRAAHGPAHVAKPHAAKLPLC